MPRLLSCLFLLLLPVARAQEEDLRLLSEWKHHNQRWVELSHRGSMLYRRLNALAFEALDRRDRQVAKLRTAEDWRNRQERVRSILNDILGPWPEKTPLNARIVGTIRREGFRIEKLVYESIPGFYVTAALYVPEGDIRDRPGILYIPGHASIGFRADHYQNVCLNLVHKGFVVLAYDPIDQGERLQNIDPETGEPFVTRRDVPHFKMHSYPGNQCYLAGVSMARYFIWDGIRGIDYLASRPEVDPSRIGVTGNSGGGNMTGFVGAIDDRVGVSVPSCWITSYRRMLAINGIQDAEQNIYHGLARGIEHADWLLARAPKPTLLLTTTRDFFPIQGARETAAEVRRAYEVLGAPANFAAVEDDHGHGYTRKNNEASYAFLMKHLDVEGDSSEREFRLFRPEELRVTPSGQVATSFSGETVFSLNRREAEGLLERLAESRKSDSHLATAVRRARELSGYQEPAPVADVVFRGGYQREEYRVEKYALISGANDVIPVALGLPSGDGPHPAVIYLHPDGKSAPPMDDLVRAGYAVLAPDVAGTGEIAPEIGRQNDHNAPFYTGLLTSTSVVGLQATDLSRIVAWIRSRGDIESESVGLIAEGPMGPTAIHAAAFNEAINWLVLDRTPLSYAAMVMNRYYTFPTSAMVAGALTAYDLPDLLASIAPRRIALRQPMDQQGDTLADTELRSSIGYDISGWKVVAAGVPLAELVRWCSP